MPLAIPKIVCQNISSNFIRHLCAIQGKSVIIVVVDWLTKFCHLGAFLANFTSKMLSIYFVHVIIKLHGIPVIVVSDNKKMFTSGFWRKINRLSGTTLRYDVWDNTWSLWGQQHMVSMWGKQQCNRNVLDISCSWSTQEMVGIVALGRIMAQFNLQCIYWNDLFLCSFWIEVTTFIEIQRGKWTNATKAEEEGLRRKSIWQLVNAHLDISQ